MTGKGKSVEEEAQQKTKTCLLLMKCNYRARHALGGGVYMSKPYEENLIGQLAQEGSLKTSTF